LDCFASSSFRQSGGVFAKAVYHFVWLKDKCILHSVEGEVAGFNSVPVTENFAQERTGAGGELMILGGIFQS
jgi:hypothetical protein